MEKFYTVDDVAAMTGLTSRTIRTYIKDGLLKGKKVGVQWRFTEKDIEELFKDKRVETEICENKNKIVYDFLEEKNKKSSVTCSIVDSRINSSEEEEFIRNEVLNYINGYKWDKQMKFSYQFFNDELLARFILEGDLREISRLIEFINNLRENEYDLN